MSPDVLYMKEKQPLVFPCRATHPNVTATLVKVSPGDTLHPHVCWVFLRYQMHSLHVIACVSTGVRPSADMCESVCGYVCERSAPKC